MLVRNGKFGRFLACSNYPDCDAILNLDKNGRVAPPKTPPLETDARCPKCDAPMYLRDGKRGLWLSCTRFPKCRGARSWKQIGEEMGEDAQRKFEAMHQEHSKRHPPVELKLLDGSPLDLNAKLDDLVALQNESGAPVGVESSVGDDAPF